MANHPLTNFYNSAYKVSTDINQHISTKVAELGRRLMPLSAHNITRTFARGQEDTIFNVNSPGVINHLSVGSKHWLKVTIDNDQIFEMHTFDVAETIIGEGGYISDLAFDNSCSVWIRGWDHTNGKASALKAVSGILK